MIPCFHCDRTSSHEYKWNSTSCPEGIPRKKNGISIANAAEAIEKSGAQISLLGGAEAALPAWLDFIAADSFVPTKLRAEG
jgi:hypothetical protein